MYVLYDSGTGSTFEFALVCSINPSMYDLANGITWLAMITSPIPANIAEIHILVFLILF